MVKRWCSESWEDHSASWMFQRPVCLFTRLEETEEAAAVNTLLLLRLCVLQPLHRLAELSPLDSHTIWKSVFNQNLKQRNLICWIFNGSATGDARLRELAEIQHFIHFACSLSERATCCYQHRSALSERLPGSAWGRGFSMRQSIGCGLKRWMESLGAGTF